MVVSFAWCRSAFEYWPGPHDRGSGLFADASLVLFCLGCLSFSAFLGIHLYLWRQKRRAMRMAALDAGLGVGGSASAAGASSPLIFPLYNKILVFCTLATLLDTLNGLFVGTGGVNRNQGGGNALLASILYGGVWAVYHFVFEGIALLMLNPGVGSFAARKSAGLAFLWAVITWVVQSWTNYAEGDTFSIILSVMWSCSLIVFYAVLWLAPLRILFRRPCVYSYARFWALMRLFVSIANLLRHYEFTSGFCLYILAVAGFQSPTVAYVVYTCLLRDCQYWLGILRWEESGYSNTRARSGKDLSSPSTVGALASGGSFLGGGSGSFANPKANGSMETLRRPLLGTSLAPHSARMLAAKMDLSKNSDGGDAAPLGANGSPQSGSKRKQGGVRILNFAFLRIDQPVDDDLDGGAGINKPQQIVLGSGSTSRVFQGTFRDRPVAIKMIFCPDLTPETVASFYHEATLLAQLSHPNVVDVLGVCVLPPAICLVMELCDGGNLFDFLRAPAQVANPLSLYRQLALSADACAAVHFLHSQVPAVLHLDLKSLNFLLSTQARPGQTVLKVADLELSREIIIAEPDADEEEKRMATITMGGAPSSAAKAKRKASAAGGGDTHKKAGSSAVPSSAVVSGSELTGFKIPEQLYWLAPELMQGLPYSEKADIYSLALVIWEIFTASVPYRSLEDSLILAARHAKYRELTGLGPEEDGDPATPGGARKGRARTSSSGSNASSTERHTPAMAGASIGAPAAMTNAHAPRDRNGNKQQQGRRSRSTSRRRYDAEEEAELASTPSSGQSSKSHSSAPSPQSPLRGQHFFAGGAAGPGTAGAAGAAGAVAVPNGTTGPAVITAQTLGVSPPSLSNLAPSSAPHVIPTRTTPPAVVPAGASADGTASLTQENLNSYQADASGSATSVARPGTASSATSSSMPPPLAAILSPVHSNEPMDVDPVLREWKRIHHHMHTNPILSPGRGSGANFESPLTQALQHTASPPLLPLTPSAMQRVGGQRSVRPNLPTVPASTGNSLLGESNMPADPDLAAAAAAAAEEARLDPLSQEGSTSDSFSILHPSDSGMSSHSPSANSGKPHYLARSAPFQSDLSPIASSLRQTPQSGMSSRSDREAAGELAFPPPNIAAGNQQQQQQQRDPAQIRQFSAPVGGSRLGAEPYGQRDMHDANLLGAEEADFSTHAADAAAAAAAAAGGAHESAAPAAWMGDSAESGDPSVRGTGTRGSQAGSTAGSEFEPAAYYPSSMPLRGSGESVLLGSDGNQFAQSSMASAEANPSSGSAGASSSGGGVGGGRIVAFHGAKTMPVTGSNATGSLAPPLSTGHSGASSPTPTSQRVPRVTNLPLKAQRRPESRKAKAAASSAAAKKKAASEQANANASSASASDANNSSLQRSASPAGSSGAPGAPRPVSFASIWVSRHEVQSQLRHLICVEHYRPTLPADMPDALASLLTRAWHPLPALRPNAADFVNTILNLTHQLKDQEASYMQQHNHAFNGNRSGEANGNADRPREDASERKEEQQ